MLSPLLATDGAKIADLDSAAQLREERRKGRKNRLRLFRQGVIQAKRSPRVLEAQAKLDAFHESLDRIAMWLARGRLDEHSASFMMPGPYVSGFGDKLTDNDDHLLKTHLEIAMNSAPNRSPRHSSAHVNGDPTRPQLTIKHDHESCQQCPFPRLALIEGSLHPITILINLWPWEPLSLFTE